MPLARFGTVRKAASTIRVGFLGRVTKLGRPTKWENMSASSPVPKPGSYVLKLLDPRQGQFRFAPAGNYRLKGPALSIVTF